MKRWNIRQKICMLLWHFVLCQLWNEYGLDTEVNNEWNESVIDRWIWMIPKKSRRQSIVEQYSYQSAADSIQRLILRSETTKSRDEMSFAVFWTDWRSSDAECSFSSRRRFSCVHVARFLLPFLSTPRFLVCLNGLTARNLCLCWKMKRQQHAAAAIRINYFNRSYWTSLLVSVSVLHRTKTLTLTQTRETREKRRRILCAWRSMLLLIFFSLFLFLAFRKCVCPYWNPRRRCQIHATQAEWVTHSFVFCWLKFSHSSHF